jgi:hypothetical protein
MALAVAIQKRPWTEPARLDWAQLTTRHGLYKVAVGLLFGLLFGLAVGLAVGLAGRFAVELVFALVFGLAVGLAFGLAFGPAGGPAGVRYGFLLVCTRGRLPWFLGRFLDWCYSANLIRVSGIAYQFRHRELQDYLATRPHPLPPAV